MTNVNRIDIKEFREFGYLHELNRKFLHPLGLALEVVVDDEGNETLGGIWDYRDDPEGISYGLDQLDADKAARVTEEVRSRVNERRKALGYWIQPATRHKSATNEP